MNISKVNKIKAIEILPNAFKQSNSAKHLSKSSVPNDQLDNQLMEDILSISDEARALLAEDDLLDSNNGALSESGLATMLEQLRESSNPSNNPYPDKTKCLQISMRIINGDEVPTKDMQFLMKNEPGLYARALLLRRQNDKPKKYKSLVDGERDDVATRESPPAEVAVEGVSESGGGEAASGEDARAE